MSTNARDKLIIHAPPDLDVEAMSKHAAASSMLADEEVASLMTFDMMILAGKERAE